jgi:hypothetical protein
MRQGQHTFDSKIKSYTSQIRLLYFEERIFMLETLQNHCDMPTTETRCSLKSFREKRLAVDSICSRPMPVQDFRFIT